MRNNYKKYGLVFAIFVLFFVFFACPVHAKAKTEIQKSIVDKAVFQGVYKCYTEKSAENKFSVKDELDPLSDYKGIKSLMNKKIADMQYIPLVTGIDGGLFGDSRYNNQDSRVKCYDLFVGGTKTLGISGGNKGILSAMGKSAEPNAGDASAIKDFMGHMGYNVYQKNESNSKCFSLSYVSSVGGGAGYARKTNQVCRGPDGIYTDNDTESGAQFSVKKSGTQICLNIISNNTSKEKGCVDIDSLDNGGSSFTGETLLAIIGVICDSSTCEEEFGQYGGQGGDKIKLIIQFDASNEISSEIGLSDYYASFATAQGAAVSDKDREDAAFKAINYLSGSDLYDSQEKIAISPLEKRVLYQAYLATYYNVEIDCTPNQSDSVFDGKIYWFDIEDKAMKECHYETSKAKRKKEKVNGVDGSGIFQYKSLSFDDLLKAFDEMPAEYSEEDIKGLVEIVEGGVEGGDSGKTTCLNSGAASSLGWILCPILQVLSDAASSAYSNVVEPALVIDSDLFSGGTDAPTREAWTIFQSMANILFIILLLVVIFSQLTGVGIDNYGIKKILPKLIISAILINLSYFICVLSVDLSNIVGKGLYNMMNNLGGFKPPTSIDGIEIAKKIGTDVALWSPAILSALMGGVWAVTTIISPAAILLTLLMGALSVVIAIFFLFLLLSAREAAVIVSIVISPLAFACFILPNTKKFFDKWLKLAWGLLLVYPICGLLVGGGNFVSKLLLTVSGSSGGFMMAITSMVVGIAPVFFIPAVLKGSFSAMGKIGDGILKVGSGMSGRAKKMAGGLGSAIKSSAGYKESQAGIAERQQRRQDVAASERAGRIHRRLTELKARGRALTREQEDQLYKADTRLNNQEQQRQTARAYADRGGFLVGSTTALSRAESALDAQELKGYSDRNENLSRADMKEELKAAIAAYSDEDGRTHENMLRLKAALASAEKQGMYAEMLDDEHGVDLTKLELSTDGTAGHEEDQKILDQLAASRNKVIGQFGRQMLKGAHRGQNLNGFAGGTGDVKLKDHVFDKQGSSALVGLDDDTLQYIRLHGRSAVASDMLISAAANTTDGKELAEIREMLNSADPDSIKFSAEQLAKLDVKTIQLLTQKAIASSELAGQFVRAQEGIANNPDLRSHLSKEAETLIFGS